MQSESPNLSTLIDALRVQLDNLRQLATLNPDDRFYAQAADQVEVVVAGLERRASPTFGLPEPPSPG